jgi:hypothetical protein
VVDAESQHFLWTALQWAAMSLNQAERVRASFEPYRAAKLSLQEVEIMRVTPEMERPEAIFWADVHFLMIAMKHLDGVLKMLGPGAPRLDNGLTATAAELRRLLEHWWESAEGKGAWKGYREKHGQFATPTQVQFDANSGDLRIGTDPLSVLIFCDVHRVESELIAIEART